MKLLLLFVSMLAAVNAYYPQYIKRRAFQQFKLRYKKNYMNETEDVLRMKIFAKNGNWISKHNKKYARGEVSFKVGINEYSDLTHREMVETLNGFNQKARVPVLGKGERGAAFIPPANVVVPSSVDWWSKGAVTPVKNQGLCSSCWAFSATGSLEGQHFRATGKLVSLSEQNLIDCSSEYGNNGCAGGLMDNSFVYIRDNGGIQDEFAYPYKADDDKCGYTANPSRPGPTVVSFTEINSGDEELLKMAVATVGPVSVALDASQESFGRYSSGVYYEKNCSIDKLDHGALVVGYGTDEKEGDYWLLKNSWGTSWGIEGYMKLARNKSNHCGVARRASYPNIETNEISRSQCLVINK